MFLYLAFDIQTGVSRHKNILFVLSLLLCVIVAKVSLAAITSSDFYAKETLNWQTQSIVQDWVDLCVICPALLLSSIFAYRGNRFATAMWAGALLYLCYTFTIYCFDVHFNMLFIDYCLVLGLAFYLSVYFVLSGYSVSSKTFKKTRAAKATAWYLISIAVLFYAMWLSEILPAIGDSVVPKAIVESGLPTNAVHVIDLSIFLPAIFLTGVLLLTKNALGYALAPSLLCFFVLMDITIAVLTRVMHQKGLEANSVVAIVMIVLAFVSLIMCAWFLRSQQSITSNETVSEGQHYFPAAV